MERVKGIEPSSQAWEARILPLNHTRLRPDSVGLRRAGPPSPDVYVGAASRHARRVESHCFYQTARRLATGLRKRLWVSLMKDGGEK
jgi:hypothetical protein